MDDVEFSRQKVEEFKKLKKPLEDFMNNYCCPHDILLATQGHMELLNGEMSEPLNILD